MTKYSYYCDRCGKEIVNTDLFASTLKISFEREFLPNSNRAQEFIDRWNYEPLLLCSDCTHTIIDYLSFKEG